MNFFTISTNLYRFRCAVVGRFNFFTMRVLATLMHLLPSITILYTLPLMLLVPITIVLTRNKMMPHNCPQLSPHLNKEFPISFLLMHTWNNSIVKKFNDYKVYLNLLEVLLVVKNHAPHVSLMCLPSNNFIKFVLKALVHFLE